MWEITTRGFTLEEVLIMAAMNLASTAPPVGSVASIRINTRLNGPQGRFNNYL